MILARLVAFSVPLEEIRRSLSQFEWDYQGDAYSFSGQDLQKVLIMYLKGSLNEEQIEEWANLIEMREDIQFTGLNSGVVESAIFELANPVLYGDVSKESAEALIKKLEGQKKSS